MKDLACESLNIVILGKGGPSDYIFFLLNTVLFKRNRSPILKSESRNQGETSCASSTDFFPISVF